jgi:pyruvate dehydrogenase E2 component (dihydrolipoyllysine-residue acetyltransferase)
MAISVVMPALEMAQESGKVISWLKREGEAVAKGEPLLEIETDKAVMEIESPGEGILAAVKARAGAEVPVGQTIAWILQPGETPPVDEAPVASGRKTSAVASSSVAGSAAASTQPAAADIRTSPKARRLAAERGVDLGKVRGSGPGGEILAADILAAAESETSAPPVVHSSSPISRLMAERTTESWTTVPHFFVVREVDAGALNEARQKLAPAIEKSRAVKLTYTDLLLALVARVLLKHPRMNASWTAEGVVRRHADVNMSVAMAVNDGVVAPVIHNAHKADLGEIAVQRRDLTERARAGKLRPHDLAGGTFTISNLGMFEVDAFTAIITPPQAAILAVGRIADRVVPVHGSPVIRPMMTLTLSSDHRVVDGVRAAEFLRDVTEAIGNPQEWFS